MSFTSLDIYKEESQDFSYILYKTLRCVEPFSIVKKDDYLYCYRIEEDIFVAYSRDHEIEFKIPLSFIKYFAVC